MECKEFKNIVIDLFDVETDPQVKAACERHMSECDACKRYYEELSEAAATLQPKETVAVAPTRSHSRAAASFIGILMVTGMAVAAIHFWGSSSSTKDEQIEAAQVENVKENPSAVNVDEQVAEVTPVVFENAELATILDEIAAYHKLQPVYKNEESKHIRLYFTWDKSTKIEDVIATFNKFERIHITQEKQQLIVE